MQLAKLNSQNVEFETSTVQVVDAVESVLERAHYRLQENSITFENMVDGGFVVIGDRLRLIEVYENLVGNNSSS